jgi:hypothetical protein
MSEGDRKSDLRRKRLAVESAMLAENHRLYTGRKWFRDRFAIALIVGLTAFFIYQLIFANASAVTHVVMFAVGLSFIFGIHFIFANQDPDPDPAATARNMAERRQRRAEAKAEKDLRNAELAKIRQTKAAEEKLRRDAENAIIAKQIAERNEAAAELAASMAMEQARIDRENKITELLMIANTDMKRALKLAGREGIDLHAEAQKRVAAGAAVVGAALGTGAKVGVEFVKHMLRSDSK